MSQTPFKFNMLNTPVKESKGLSKIRSIIENSAKAFKNDITSIRNMVSNEKDRAEAEIEFKKTETGKKIEELKKINLTDLQSGDLQLISNDLEKEFTELRPLMATEPVIKSALPLATLAVVAAEPIRIKTQKEMSFFN